ncbi:glucosamine-6-phosphate deaminase [Alteribacter lacisalsi]|uniref:Glucosamine-6-phosphate deaminase n=1 Tax=Alteribacter lacisalsi TaxID=2045244 RepID=A0A2W0HGM7_9BACI|nr:glucosamine-6-phosphate deaminase [Alteribacter lacisalsi]PYZ95939.1 glucosamine-6-phosphate deaminase [Alteribacter lacisalsi]
MELLIVDDAEEMSEKAASVLYDVIGEKQRAVLGLATGGTPVRTYKILSSRLNRAKKPLDHVHTVNLDEYIGLSPSDPNSYHSYMEKHLFQHTAIPKDQTHLPDGMAEDLAAECRRYEQLINSLGGTDIQLLGVGNNGHIGFNEPGTPFNQSTHVIDLVESTRKANARFFPSLDDVPRRAITMGISTIMKSRRILLIASGKGKADALKELFSGPQTEKVPVTALQSHPQVLVIADKQAASKM